MGLAIEMQVEVKPTIAFCKCYVCEKEVKKGQVRFKVVATGYRQSRGIFVHIPCLFRFLSKELSKLGGYKGKRKDFLKGVAMGIGLTTD